MQPLGHKLYIALSFHFSSLCAALYGGYLRYMCMYGYQELPTAVVYVVCCAWTDFLVKALAILSLPSFFRYSAKRVMSRAY